MIRYRSIKGARSSLPNLQSTSPNSNLQPPQDRRPSQTLITPPLVMLRATNKKKHLPSVLWEQHSNPVSNYFTQFNFLDTYSWQLSLEAQPLSTGLSPGSFHISTSLTSYRYPSASLVRPCQSDSPVLSWVATMASPSADSPVDESPGGENLSDRKTLKTETVFLGITRNYLKDRPEWAKEKGFRELVQNW
jgi:hypothetical protein